MVSEAFCHILWHIGNRWDVAKAGILDAGGLALGMAIGAVIGFFIAPVGLAIGLTVGASLLTGLAIDAVKDQWLRKKMEKTLDLITIVQIFVVLIICIFLGVCLFKVE